MKQSTYTHYFFLGIAAFVVVALELGCGQDSNLYHSDTLAFENTATISSKTVEDELDLGADESSNFWLNYYYPWMVPFSPFPLYDYYLEPLAVEIPISPVASVFDFVHPFYAYRFISPFYDGGFDDDDSDHHHDRDDDR